MALKLRPHDIRSPDIFGQHKMERSSSIDPRIWRNWEDHVSLPIVIRQKYVLELRGVEGRNAIKAMVIPVLKDLGVRPINYGACGSMGCTVVNFRTEQDLLAAKLALSEITAV